MNQINSERSDGLLTYVFASGSPDHYMNATVYHEGLTLGQAFRNGRKYHGIELPLGMDHSGTLFIAHYSFCGLDCWG